MSLRKKILATTATLAFLGAGAVAGTNEDPRSKAQDNQPAVTQEAPPTPPPKHKAPSQRDSRTKKPDSQKKEQQRVVPAPRHRADERQRIVPHDQRIVPRHRVPTPDLRHSQPERWRHQYVLPQHSWWYQNWPRYWWSVDINLSTGWPYSHLWCWDNLSHYRVYESRGTLRTFEVMPPPGYDEAVVAYFRSPGERTIRVELTKETRDGIELTVLRDDDVDGSLESAIEVEGETRHGAQQNYLRGRDRDEYRLPWRHADALYSYVWPDIQEQL